MVVFSKSFPFFSPPGSAYLAARHNQAGFLIAHEICFVMAFDGVGIFTGVRNGVGGYGLVLSWGYLDTSMGAAMRHSSIMSGFLLFLVLVHPGRLSCYGWGCGGSPCP